MRGGAVAIAVALATWLLALAAVLAVVSPGWSRGIGGWALVVLVTFLAIGLAAWKIGRGPWSGPAPVRPWAGRAPQGPAPERVARDDPLSGEYLAHVVERAGERARSEGTVSEGLAEVRPELRTQLVGVLVRGGASRAEAERIVSEGRWTDDRAAAAVFDPGIRPPDRSVHDRVVAWLFPERAVRERVRRAVGELAATADAQLPPVVGQAAPRDVPVLQPTLSDLQRTADGTLQPAGRRPAGLPGPDADEPPAPRTPDEQDDDGRPGRTTSGRRPSDDSTGAADRDRRAGTWDDLRGADE